MSFGRRWRGRGAREGDDGVEWGAEGDVGGERGRGGEGRGGEGVSACMVDAGLSVLHIL